MPRSEPATLWGLTAAAGLPAHRFIADAQSRVALHDLASAGTLDVPAEAMRGRCVVISSARQLIGALVLLQLDGVAARIVLCPPDLAADHLAAVMTEAQATAIVSDEAGCSAQPSAACAGATLFAACHAEPRPSEDHRRRPRAARRSATEWLLLTSGTSGRPKLVVHTLDSLTAPLRGAATGVDGAVWSTFYDIRRYGGLQILLRALTGGGSILLRDPREGLADFLDRAGALGVTHMSGTPSHWRLALMSGAADRMAPRYIRLSGEPVDQAILNQLAAAFPAATVAHAFASTEAGVAFDVRDGLAGFPAGVIGADRGGVDLRVENGSLRIRSPGMARGYLGGSRPLADRDGYIDTGDLVELHDGRYRFLGRREGVINAGGRKVHPEEVEAVINRQPGVQMARVRARPSPITGALVVADIVMQPAAVGSFDRIRAQVLAACRASLEPYKVPSMLKPVASLDIAQSGKLLRRHA